jgi:hypothetical protein
MDGYVLEDLLLLGIKLVALYGCLGLIVAIFTTPTTKG